MITQQQLLDFFIPKLNQSFSRYQKKSLIRARKASVGQEVITFSSDGIETKNTASEGDWLVENQTSIKERYLVKAETFEKKYRLKDSLGDGWGCYQPKGFVFAIEASEELLKNLGAQSQLEFEAPWKESMIVKIGDFLVIPEALHEIYRIAKKEFGETYQEVKG